MKVSELEGPTLDYWVAKACGWLEENGLNFEEMTPQFWEENLVSDMFAPSTRWEDGGPIIDRESIELTGRWAAHMKAKQPRGGRVMLPGTHQHGPTLLIAAMRCYVASKFGEEVPSK